MTYGSVKPERWCHSMVERKNMGRNRINSLTSQVTPRRGNLQFLERSLQSDGRFRHDANFEWDFPFVNATNFELYSLWIMWVRIASIAKGPWSNWGRTLLQLTVLSLGGVCCSLSYNVKWQRREQIFFITKLFLMLCWCIFMSITCRTLSNPFWNRDMLIMKTPYSSIFKYSSELFGNDVINSAATYRVVWAYNS